MIVVQSVLCLVIPVLMWYLGKTFRNGAVPYKKEKGVRFRSKRALASEQSWTFSNDLFFNSLTLASTVPTFFLYFFIIFKFCILYFKL